MSRLPAGTHLDDPPRQTIHGAMVFKPFKPPLIRKPESSSTEKTHEEAHTAKKPRLQEDDAAVNIETRPATLTSRKPLLQVQNVGKDAAVKPQPGSFSKEDATYERFFNALWLVTAIG